jgi:hypothetical protein
MKSTRFSMSRGVLVALAASGLMLGSCQSARTHSPAAVETGQNQVEQRDYQTRAFDTTDPEQALRIVIATLQDLGFVIDQANATLGAVSASRSGRRPMRITVTVRPRGAAQMLVRANAQTRRAPVTDPWQYQQFFAALEKAMFLKAHEVD